MVFQYFGCHSFFFSFFYYFFFLLYQNIHVCAVVLFSWFSLACKLQMTICTHPLVLAFSLSVSHSATVFYGMWKLENHFVWLAEGRL